MFFRVVLLCVLCVVVSRSDDLLVGNSSNSALAYMENVKLSAIPLTTRTKNVFYDSNSTRIIKAIVAKDNEKSKATAIITAGGIGSTYVNLRMKSERGKGLNYMIQIYN